MTEKHKQTLKEDLILRGIKLIDIGYITCIYTIPSIYIATFLDNHVYPYIGPYKNKSDEEKTQYEILIELIIFLTINGIIAYILRNLLQMIPFPLENVYGFKHMKVKEVQSGQLIGLILLWFSSTIRNKLLLLQKKISKK